jgi:glycosyltransferase involved in cell wall biosynthesis
MTPRVVERIPTITVVVPTFNRADFLAECLDSLLAQTLAASQIVVVNDGSTDDTCRVLGPYMDEIEYFETPHVGKPSAIKRATGEYLWIFDDDDVALPDAHERLVKPLEEHPEYGFSYSPFFFTGSLPDDTIGEIRDESGIPNLHERGFLIPLLESNFLGGAALFARTSCYAVVGEFDPRLLRSQDYDMAIRIARRFKGIRAPGGSTFHYRQHDGLRGNSRDRFAVGKRLLRWLEYDQIIFQEIHHDLPLADYLPPGLTLPAGKRHALLQRLAVAASKLLIREAGADLRELAALADTTPYSAEELKIVRSLVERRPYYGVGNLLERREFQSEVFMRCSSSVSMRLFRKQIWRALLVRFRQRPGLKRLLGDLHRYRHLYLAQPSRIPLI